MMILSATFTKHLAASSLPKRAARTLIRVDPISIIATNNHTHPRTNLAYFPSITSTSRSLASSSSRNLKSILVREIAEEMEAGAGSNTLPEELATLYNDITEHWTIGSNGATVRMLKKENGINGAKIGIVFHCQDTEETDEYMYQEDTQEQEEPSTAVRFEVTVSKGSKTLVIECMFSEMELSVLSVEMRDGDAEAALAALVVKEELNSSLYQGVEFTDLPEYLQEAFKDYVDEECGVNEDVQTFIMMFAHHRDHEEYVKWMQTVKSVLT